MGVSNPSGVPDPGADGQIRTFSPEFASFSWNSIGETCSEVSIRLS